MLLDFINMSEKKIICDLNKVLLLETDLERWGDLPEATLCL